MIACPKPKPTKRRHPDAALDRRESAKVRVRSNGQCEVVSPYLNIVTGEVVLARCPRRAVHVMHLIGGRGKRGIGPSALKEHKLHGCLEHHDGIDGKLGGKKYERIGGTVPLWTDPYRRVR